MESFLYKADMDGSSLLHMAVDGGVVKVSSVYTLFQNDGNYIILLSSC